MHKLPRFLLLVVVLALGTATPMHASDRRDHERARAALAAGEIKPLGEFVTAIEQRYVGRIVETELERDGGRWIYEIKLLPPSGRVVELKFDAATGALLSSRGPLQERR